MDNKLNSEANVVPTYDVFKNGSIGKEEPVKQEQEKSLLDQVYSGEADTNVVSSAYENTEARYQIQKEAIRRMGYENTTEGALRNRADELAGGLGNKKILSKEEASLYAKQQGYDMKFSKPISQGELDVRLNTRRRKDAYQAILNECASQQNNNYSLAQQALLLGAGIASSTTVPEVVGMTALSMFVYPALGSVAFKALADIGAKTGKAKAAVEALKLAQKSIVLDRNATALSNNLNYFQKVLYDSYRFTQGAMGARASLMSTAVPFALDAIATDIPRVALLEDQARRLQDGSYSMKEGLAELVGAGAIGMAMPFVGAGASFAGKTLYNVFERGIDKAHLKIAGDAVRGYNVDQEVKAIEEGTEALIKNNTKGTVPYVEQNANFFKNTNMSEEEAATHIVELITNPGADISQLKCKNILLSSKEGIADFLQECKQAGKTVEEVVQLLKERLPITEKVGTRELLSKLVIEGEYGLLGSGGGFFGVDADEALTFMAHLYQARLNDDTQALNAAEQILVSQDKKIAFLKKFLADYNEIFEHSKATSRKGTDKYMYTGLNGEVKSYYDPTGREDIFTDLYRCFASDKDIAELESALDIMDKYRLERSTKGSVSKETNAAWKEAKKVFKKLDDFIESMTIKHVDRKGRVHLDLVGLNGDDTSSEVGLLQKLVHEFEEGFESNMEAYSGANNPMAGVPPDEINRALHEGRIEELPQLSFLSRLQSLDYHAANSAIGSDVQLAVERVNAAKIAYKQTAEDTKESTDFLVGYINAAKEQTEKQAYSGPAGLLLDTQRVIEGVDKLISTSFAKLRNDILEAVKKGKFFNETLPRLIAEDGGDLTRVRHLLHTKDNPLKKVLGDFAASYQTEAGVDVVREGGLAEALNKTIDNMVDAMAEDPEFLGKLTKVIEMDIDNTGNVSKTAENIAKFEELEQQKQLLQKKIQPLLDYTTNTLLEAQTVALNTQRSILDLFNAVYKQPALRKETLAGFVTYTPLSMKGSSLSIEAMQDIGGAYREFYKKLQGLSEEAMTYANENWDEVSKALMYMSKYDDEHLTAMGIKLNDQASGVARVFLDTLTDEQKLLYSVGSGKTKVGSLLSNSKLSEMIYRISADEAVRYKANIVNASTLVYKTIKNGKVIEDEGMAAIADVLDELGGLSLQAVEKNVSEELREEAARIGANIENQYEGMNRAAYYLFNVIDCDAHFNKSNARDLPLNKIRDAFLGTSKDVEDLIAEHGYKKVENGLRLIVEGIQGNVVSKAHKPGDPVTYGLINRITGQVKDAKATATSKAAKYLDDLDAKLHFKDDETELQAVRKFGHDSLRQCVENNLTQTRGAYGILAKTGARPMEFMEEMINLTNAYFGSKEAHARLTPTQLKRAEIYKADIDHIMYYMNRACNNDIQPLSLGWRIAHIISNIVAAPMLVKAGIKSFSDYAFQHQAMVSAGLMSGTDIREWGYTLANIGNIFKRGDQDILNMLFLSNQLKQDTISRALMYDGHSLSPVGFKDFFFNPKKFWDAGNKELNDLAPRVMQWENRARTFADRFVNKIAFVGPVTEYNRANAALNIMRGLGSFADVAYKDFAKATGDARQAQRLQMLLHRHGITEYEWDNLFRKCMTSVDSYVKEIRGVETGCMDNVLFFADKMASLSDDDLRAAIAHARGITSEKGMAEITEVQIDNYRRELCDKANILVNMGANEMTSLPNIRTQGQLNFWTEPGSGIGEAIRILTKFQSFSMSVTQLHYGRRLASRLNTMDPNDRTSTLYKSLIDETFGQDTKGTIKDMLGLLGSVMLTQYAINEAVSRLPGGRHKKDVVTADKFIDVFGQSIGIAGPFFDAIVNGYEMRGNGGALALGMAPVPSAIVRDVSGIGHALTRKGAEGQRGLALAGAVGESLANHIGLSRHCFTQAAYTMLLGDRFKQWQMGSSYPSYVNRMEQMGYTDGWVQWVLENAADRFAELSNP